MEGINSNDALRLLEYVKQNSTPDGGGISICSGKCSVDDCISYASHGLMVCPYHAATTPTWQDKDQVAYCFNCYEIFGLLGTDGIARKHHCHICGLVLCGDCSDYQLSPRVALPLSKPGASYRHSLAKLFRPRERRICIKCASFTHPSLTIKQTYNPIYNQYQHVPIDIRFVFDGTASMISHINLVEREIDRIVSDISTHHFVDPQFSAITYRDHSYGSQLANIIPPQNHHRKFERLIDHVRAFAAPGGNDIPEAMAVGLGIAQGLYWRPFAAKMVILIADAPPHGKGYSNLVSNLGDQYSECDPSGLDPVKLVESLHRDGVTVYTIGVEPGSNETGADRVLSRLAGLGGGVAIPLLEEHHENLHHFIAACACDLLMKRVVEQELERLAIEHGQMTVQQRTATAVINVTKRLRSRYMPRFTYGQARSLTSTSSFAQLPRVTGYHREYMTDGDISSYVTSANSG